MADVVIERCTIRVVRRGGWRWGAEPRRVVEAATRVLPALLARHLIAAWPDDAQGEITQPVQVALSLPVGALAELGSGTMAVGPLRELDDAVALAVAELPERIRPVRQPIGPAPVEPADAAPEVRWAGTVLRLLAGWYESGALPEMLARLSRAALAAWERAVFETDGAAPAPPAPVAPERIEEVLDAVRVGVTSDDVAAAARLRARLEAAVAVFVRLGLVPGAAPARAALDRRFPAEPGAPARDAAGAPPERAAATAPAGAARDAAVEIGRRAQHGAVEVRALPFLMLAPLAQIGWLEAAGAALSAAGCEHALPALAAALALKVLDPPERGWRRTPLAMASAAAFAGLEAFDESPIADLARDADAVCSPLDAVVARAVMAGHSGGEPFALVRPVEADAGLLLVEAEGLFPIAWAPDDGAAARLAEGLPEAPLLVAPAAARPLLLRGLDRAGRRFVTSAPPTRGERWQRITGAPGERYYTNGAADAGLLATARLLAFVDGEAGAIWRALALRRAAPRTGATLDRSLALAAMTALAYLAWSLWRTRETPHPRLALERFADLAAWTTPHDAAIDVRVPLGPRHADLRSHGLLDDVARVPWLGRLVRFAGG